MKKTEHNINIFKTQSGRTARTVSGWKKLPQDRTTVTGPSMTVPNMSYEIKDLLTGYAKGIDLLGTNQEGIYDDEPTHDQLDASAFGRMDIAEQAETIGNTISKSKELQAKLKALAQPLASSKVEETPPTNPPTKPQT